MTSWEEIEIQAMTNIKNELSLEWDMRNRLPVFYNRMCGYMKEAIPLFNRPSKMLLRLSKFTEPQFTSAAIETETDIESGHTFSNMPTGYDITSAGIITFDEYNNDPEYIPVPISYNSTNGTITINRDIPHERTLVFDFYKGGYFDADLNMTEKEILAYCIYVKWEHRFDNNAIERMSKQRDSSFTTISEASQTNANTARMRAADETLFAKLRAYEQNLAVLSGVDGINLI